MDFKTILICRGEGYINFHLKALKGSNFKDASFTAATNYCNDIPITCFPYKYKGSLIKEVVLKVPLLNFKKIILTVSNSSGSKKQIFSERTIAIHSKLNYGVHRAKALAIREIPQNIYTNAAEINITSFSILRFYDPYRCLVKGTVTIPEQTKTSEIFFSDLQGNNRLPIDCHFVQHKVLHGIPSSVFSFSHRFITDEGGCLIATAKNTQPGFFVFNQQHLHAIHERYSTEGYVLARYDQYTAHRLSENSRRRLQAQKIVIDYDDAPLFSIVTPLFNTPVTLFREMIESVLEQSYTKWELILVNASPENNALTQELCALIDDRIHVITLEKNLGIAENTNQGIANAKGDFVCFFDHDDLLEPEALLFYYEYLQKHPETDVLYCDEDFLDEQGRFLDPHYKPDFSIDLLRVHNYITHLFTVRSSLLDKNLLDSRFDGAQDYDLALRIAEQTTNFGHVPHVLYHWRKSETSTAKSINSKTYTIDAGRKALEAHLSRCNLAANVTNTDTACFYHVEYQVNDNPLVSIIIPNKDHIDVLDRCLKSIKNLTSYQNYEIIIIENNSTEQNTFDYYKNIEGQWNNVTIIFWPGTFNYSKINNFGASHANGDYLILLNNDTEIISPNWIEAMLGYCQREDVGAVGAKLLYPDNTIQHAGIKMIKPSNPLESGGPIHVFHQMDGRDPGYMRRAIIPQNVTAVTAACLMTKRSLYQELGGLDERFDVAYNDVDYCLKIRAAGKLIVFNPDALLYHYESVSRGFDDETSGKKNYARFLSEKGLLMHKWGNVFASDDLYHRFA